MQSIIKNTTSSDKTIQRVQDTQVLKGGVPYNFSNSTGNSDPGSGILRYNNNTAITSVSAIYISIYDVLNNNLTNWLQTWDNNPKTPKGYLTSCNRESEIILNTFAITSIIPLTDYYKINVSYVSGIFPTDNTALMIHFSRTGNEVIQGTYNQNTSSGSSGSSGSGGKPTLELKKNGIVGFLKYSLNKTKSV